MPYAHAGYPLRDYGRYGILLLDILLLSHISVDSSRAPSWLSTLVERSSDSNRTTLSIRESRTAEVAISKHLSIQSLESNVSLTIGGKVGIHSSKSKVEISELNLTATIRSNSSLLQFDESGRRVELRAGGRTFLEIKLSSIQMRGVGDELELKCDPGTSGSESTKLHAALAGVVNMSIVDTLTGTEIQTRNGRIAGVIAETWSTNNNITRRLSIFSSLVDDTGEASTARQLAIAAFSPTYGMQIRVEEAEVSLIYGHTRVDISADHRSIVLFSRKGKIELHTVSSPLEIVVDDNTGLIINSYRERAIVGIPPDSSHINIVVGQPSRIEVNRTVSGSVRLLGGNPTTDPISNETTLSLGDLDTVFERIEFISLSVQMVIKTTDHLTESNFTSILINGSQSKMLLSTNGTSASITSARQIVEISGVDQTLKMRAGNVTLSLSLNDTGGTVDRADSLNASFLKDKEDDLEKIGPFEFGNQIATLAEPIQDHEIQSTSLATTSEKLLLISKPTPEPTGVHLQADLFNLTIPTTPPTETVPIVFPTPRESLLTFSAPETGTTIVTGWTVTTQTTSIEPSTTSTTVSSTTTTTSTFLTSPIPTTSTFLTSPIPTTSTFLTSPIPTTSTFLTSPVPTTSSSTAKARNVANTVGHSLDEGVTSVTRPITSRPTDDFVFGQYETPDSLFPILEIQATITNVELQTRSTTTITSAATISPGAGVNTTIASIREGKTGGSAESVATKRGTRELPKEWRRDREEDEQQPILELELLVDNPVNVRSEGFKTVLEDALSRALSSLSPTAKAISSRPKRTMSGDEASFPIHVNIMRVDSSEGTANTANGMPIRVTFAVDSANPSQSVNDLSQISLDELNSRLPYEAISNIAVKQRSPPLHSIVSSFAFSIPIGCVILGGCVVAVFSLAIAKMALEDCVKQRTLIADSYHNRKMANLGSSLTPIR